MSKLGEEAAAWLTSRQDEMEAHLAELVEVNSFAENVAGGNRVGAALKGLFAVSGLACEVVKSQRYADHMVFHSQGAGEPVALLGHLDTVFPPGTFEGYRRDGELRRGPGVLDMKGGLVVMAYAVRALAAVGEPSSLPSLRIVVVSDEEVGSPEGQSVIRDAIAGCRAALVFESGRAHDAIITCRKGTGMFSVTAQGVAAHAGNAHEQGKNAIWALAKFVDRAQALTDYARGVTVNVGVISGGRSKNTVPDHAQAQVDFRFLSPSDAQALEEKLRLAAVEASQGVPGTRLTLAGGVSRAPLSRTETSLALLAEYAACARASGLGDGEAPLCGGGSDASTAAAMGIPSIDGLGPRGKGFHTVEEHIEVSSLVPKAQALARFLGQPHAWR
ncbi:MAG: M20 family metallopeptidase [Myxococcota bacterium]